MNDQTPAGAGGAIIGLVGAGNIGSQTAVLLTGIEALGGVRIIDPDSYDESNLGRQRITRADVGRRKVEVPARFLRKAAPRLVVETFAQPFESMPAGLLRVAALVSCVDSRKSRQSINRIARALGVPWIDAALDRGGQVRARIYWPGDADCLECAWGPRDYELLEQEVPCAGSGTASPAPQVNATAAPQELGAVAAGLQVSLLRCVLSGEREDTPARGHQFFYDFSSGRGWIGTYTANPACRLDHAPWQITDLARSATDLALSEALRLPGGDGKESALALEGQFFVHGYLHCTRCGATRKAAGHLLSRVRTRACRACGALMTASAADGTDVLTACNVPASMLDKPLSAFGLVAGDIFAVRSKSGTRHYQLCATREETT